MVIAINTSSLLGTFIQICKSTIAIPIQWTIIPVFNGLYHVLYHVFLVPMSMMIRIMFYTFIYLPLKPFLYVLAVDENMQVLDIIRHFKFFLIHFVHYTMVAIILGVVVGAFTGFNLRLVSYFLTRTPKKAPKSKTDLQVMPENSKKRPTFISDLGNHVAIKDPLVSKPQYYGNINTRENYSIRQANQNNDDSESNEGSYIFEDDDGYNYSSFDNVSLAPRSSNSNEPIYISGVDMLNDDSIIPEENESESSTENYNMGHNVKYDNDYIREEDTMGSKNDLFSVNRNENTGTMHTEISTILKPSKPPKPLNPR